MVAGQHRQRWCQPLRALADSLQVVVEPGWLTAHKQLEWLELCVQKLRPPGQYRFLRSVISATQARIGPGHVKHRNAVRARTRPESRNGVVDGLEFDARLNRRGAHCRLPRAADPPVVVGSDQFSSRTESTQSEPSRAAT
jgi:hypothetical protein